MTVRLILASASPARLQTLRRAGVRPEVVVSGVDESLVSRETSADLVLALAELKGQAVLDLLSPTDDVIVVACDSMLELDGQSFGKPDDAAEAVARWRTMRGRDGILHTGHWVV
ncbi:MAG TPA: septum formation inhibitor Maf, partial [Propionibacteriaceae bacterium]|nr:septum formation inhibitor Maf [Propionibacteriaceae bacterium]